MAISKIGTNSIDTITGINFADSQTTSADANTLDDYEEGTYDATVTCSSSGTITVNSSNNAASYRKIGSLCQVSSDLSMSAVSSPVGYAQISLPFAVVAESEDSDRAAQAVVVHGSGSNVANYVAATFSGEQVCRIFLGDNGDLQSDAANSIDSNTEIYFNVVYHTA